LDVVDLGQKISVMALPIILAVVLHEYAHGWMASQKGDQTARMMGRLTLNPVVHIDPFGTIILPILFYISSGFLFAFAKPVPVNFWNLRRPKEDMVWVAAAGPGMNLILAGVSALLIHLILKFVPGVSEAILSQENPLAMGNVFGGSFFVPILLMLIFSVQLNVILAVINLIPIPPADGGRIMVGLLPAPQSLALSRIEPIGIFLIIGILIFNPFGILNVTLYPMIHGMIRMLL
jgi:Zn-dependent protease